MSVGWRPSCSVEHLRLRAQMLSAIRRFFDERQVLEVETPLLCHATGTDPQLDFFTSQFNFQPHRQTLFLQTSPEFAMKRLLAAGSGSIYQICKAFRNGEAGRYHNPEFTILEWYRPDFGLPELMAEVAELLGVLLQPFFSMSVRTVPYQTLFQERTGLDPLVFDLSIYRAYALAQGCEEAPALCGDDHALWLDFIFSHKVQSAMTHRVLYLVHGYPAIQSSLARINVNDNRISERFEVFVNGVELGNGFFELADAAEQEARFDKEIAHRQTHGLPAVGKDQRFLGALRAGFPDCSGVAVGLDRLLMVATGAAAIDQVLAFAVGNA